MEANSSISHVQFTVPTALGSGSPQCPPSPVPGRHLPAISQISRDMQGRIGVNISNSPFYPSFSPSVVFWASSLRVPRSWYMANIIGIPSTSAQNGLTTPVEELPLSSLPFLGTSLKLAQISPPIPSPRPTI